jgi:branched-chain amino acid aminotransferase
MDDLTYYVNGKFVPAAEAVLPLNDLGIARGYGVFDLLRTYGRVPFRLHDHLRRLQFSAEAIGIALPWDMEEIAEIVLDVNERAGRDDVALRIVVTGGPSDNFMTPQGRPSLVVMAHPIVPYPAHYYADGCKATTTRIERIMPTVKSLNYIGAIMAVGEATRQHAVEAIYTDSDDRLTEGTRANLFAFRGDCLVTPAEGILRGITRQVVLELAAADFEIVEGPIACGDLGVLDEVFLTSTTKEVLPIVQIDDVRIGAGRPGPNTQRLMARFRAYVGQVCARQSLASPRANST